MAVISKGIYISLNEVPLSNLMEIPELGGDTEAIEITTLEDAAHMYCDGIKNYGDNLSFKFLYDKEQFNRLIEESADEGCFVVILPDDMTCSFNGTFSVKLDGVGVNAALTYTLNIKPTSTMSWSQG